jgi:hypothetical protein
MILKAVEPLEKTSENEEDQKILTALSTIGIDWSTASSPEAPQAQVSFFVEGKQPGEPLSAGEEAKLTLRVKNVGRGDFYRLIAGTESENLLFKNKEFIFGHLKSGETRSWTTKIKVPESALSREDEIKFVFREANDPEVFTSLITIYSSKPRPFRLQLPFDSDSKGQNPRSPSPENIGAGRGRRRS